MTELSDLGALRVQGADSVRFLQGQLSNDVTRLAADRSLLAGLHNPQGRTIALLRLVMLAPDELLALLPRELVGQVADRLRKYVLRSKVTLADASSAWRIRGLIAPAALATGETPAEHHLSSLSAELLPGIEWPRAVNAQVAADHAVLVRIADAPARYLLITPADRADPVRDLAPADREAWRALDVASGLPQVYPATSEAFVAQMINLDAIEAVSFNKGCYTGQEVIARAHYRGKVKRRMQRFRSLEACTLAPGDSGQLTDGRSFKVVEATRLEDGRCEFLAVAPLASGDDEPGAAPASEPAALRAEPLELPYALPA